MDQQRDEVAKLIKKAGVIAFELDLSDRPNPAGAPELAKITGARKPSGEPLPPPHQNNPASRGGSSKRQNAGGQSGLPGRGGHGGRGGRGGTGGRGSRNRSRNGKPGGSGRRGGGQR